ncbi:MAG: hypothetical protein JXA97_09290 [Anaerolineales bacterium]|nr:hypothetical protein [Anaerolineales bacterium]
MKQIVLVCLTLLLAAGCQSSAPSAELTGTPRGTQSLPPAHTPTAAPTPLPTLIPTLELLEPDPSRALLPGAEAAFEGEPRYQIDMAVGFSSSGAVIDGTARILYTNQGGQALKTLVFMLLPNQFQEEPVMTAGSILVDGELHAGVLSPDGTALTVVLNHALSPGGVVDVSIPYRIETGLSEGVLFLPAPYPLLPRNDGEWHESLSPYASGGRGFPVAHYDVQIVLPEELSLAASGTEVGQEPAGNGLQRRRVIAGPVRLFTFAAGRFEEATQTVGDVELRVWTRPGHSEDAAAVLASAAEQLTLLGSLWGDYPFRELDFVDVPRSAAQGFPGVALIGTFGTNTVLVDVLDTVTQQWTSALVGSDPIEEPWVGEAMTGFARTLYEENRNSVGAATGYLSDLRAVLRDSPDPDRPIGLAAEDFTSLSDYLVLARYKGALFLEALRWEIGPTAFFAFLEAVFTEYQFGFVSGEDVQAAVEAACSCDLTDVFDDWVWTGGELMTP